MELDVADVAVVPLLFAADVLFVEDAETVPDTVLALEPVPEIAELPLEAAVPELGVLPMKPEPVPPDEEGELDALDALEFVAALLDVELVDDVSPATETIVVNSVAR